MNGKQFIMRCTVCGNRFDRYYFRCPKCGERIKHTKMLRNIALAALLICFILALALMIFLPGRNSGIQKTGNGEQISYDGEYAQYAIGQLISDFSSDVVETEKKYLGKRIEFSGIISEFDQNVSRITVIPEDGNSNDVPICVYIKDGIPHGSLNAGDTVTVCGIVISVGEKVGFAINAEKTE